MPEPKARQLDGYDEFGILVALAFLESTGWTVYAKRKQWPKQQRDAAELLMKSHGAAEIKESWWA